MKTVDTDMEKDIDDFKWSQNSDYLTYTRINNKNGIICIYDIDSDKIHEVTGAFYNASNPVFSRDGKYLFYTSDQHFSPSYSQFDGTWIYAQATVLMAASLSENDSSILTPPNDMEEVEEMKDTKDSKEKKSKSKKDKSNKKDDKKPMVIDYPGMESRSVQLPVEPGNYGNLTMAEGKLIYSARNQRDTWIKYFDVKERKEEIILEGVYSYELSADGKKLIYSMGGNSSGYGIVDVGSGKTKGDGKLDLSDVRAKIDPVQEWSQIFNEAWRLERDFFYDENMHGIDWSKMKERYGKLLPYCTSRNDLNYIIGEMISELNVGHAYIAGGDIPRHDYLGVGLLGADLTTIGTSKAKGSKGAIRIDKIYQGAPWDVKVISPLHGSGMHVHSGDYITAVNQMPIDGDKSPYAAFQNLNNKRVILTISSTPDGKDGRDVELKLMGSEARLRNLAWIEGNRQKVLKATNGRCGYIYVPNTGIQGQNELFRMYQGQYHLSSMIIDERWNSGGQIPHRFVALLNHPIRSHFSRRNKNSFNVPYNGMDGPKVMIANQWAGSGGDMFPYIFKQEKVGPVVGKRTWGGLVGIGGTPSLIDGGFLSTPHFAFFNNKGEWDVEGVGITPDYEVDASPEDMFKGNDAQLNKSISLILED